MPQEPTNVNKSLASEIHQKLTDRDTRFMTHDLCPENVCSELLRRIRRKPFPAASSNQGLTKTQ